MADPAPLQQQFVVSARKYRPSTFDTVVGQGHITSTLKNAIGQNHLAQAFLFCGPRGVGKTTCARILAKVLNCTNRTAEVEPCNECDNCRAFNQNASFNVHELDAASNNSVEDIRSLVDQVRYPPHSGKYKIYIIDEVHMLSNAAFNAFLKTLEEPPSYAIFILATTEKHKIIPTILSRCQIFDFNRIKIDDIVGQLEKVATSEHIQAEPDALHVIARKADGGMRDALSMFDLVSTFSTDRSVTYAGAVEHLNVLDYEYYFRMAEALWKGEGGQALLMFDEVLKRGFDGHIFITGLAEHLRNLLMSKDQATLRLLEVPENTAGKFLQQGKAIPSSFLLTALNLASTADGQYRNARNQRLLVEINLLKMANIRNAIDLVQASQQAQRVAQAPAIVEAEKKNDGPSLNSTLASEPAAPVVPATPSLTGTAAAKVSGAFSTISLNKKPAAPEASKPEPASPQPATGNLELGNSPFDTKALTQAWEALKESVSQAGQTARAGLLSACSIQMEEAGAVKVLVPNSLAAESFLKIRADVLTFLRKQVDNGALDFDIEVSKEIKQSIPYSDKDRLIALAEKYPEVEEWVKELGLSTEY